MYAQLAWILDQPAVYAAAVPVLGVAGSIIPVVAKGRQVSHEAMMILIGLAGLLAIGGWSQPFFGDERDTLVYIAFGVAALVPVLASLGGNGATLIAGEAPVGIPPAHMIGALGSMLLFLAATAAGALRVIDPLDLIGTTADTGVLNLVAVAAILGALGGWWFWAPKTDGRLFSGIQGLGAMTFLLLGGVLLGATDVIAGFVDTPDVLLASADDSLGDAMIVLSMIGSIVVLLGVLGALGAISLAYVKPGEADDDPWGGHTLEWATATPPPVGNFAEPPARVRSEAPLLDETPGDEEESPDDRHHHPARRSRNPPAPHGARRHHVRQRRCPHDLLRRARCLCQRAAAARDAGEEWFPEGVIELGPSGWIFWTLVLAAFTVQWAVQAIRNDDRPNAYIALALTGMFGAAVFNQLWFIINDTGFALAGTQGQFLFFVMTGTYIVFLIGAVVFLALTTMRALFGQFGPSQDDGVAAAAMFWHAVSVMYWVTWIAIFVTK